MPPSARLALTHLRAAVHGGDAPPGVIDFSTGVSPLPVPEPVLAAGRAADVRRYPPPTAPPPRLATARAPGRDPGGGVAGGGSPQVIWGRARALGGTRR